MAHSHPDVVRVEDLRTSRGGTRHWLSNGLFVMEEKQSGGGRSRYALWQPSQSKSPTIAPKLLGHANTLRQILTMAAEKRPVPAANGVKRAAKPRPQVAVATTAKEPTVALSTTPVPAPATAPTAEPAADAEGPKIHPEVRFEVITADRHWAEQALARNIERNRNLKDAKIESWAEDMLDGNWELDGSPIKFDWHDRMCDGQNRLHALIRANELAARTNRPAVTVPFAVVYGIKPSAVEVMDQGTRRSLGDVLKMRGYANSTPLAGVIHAFVRYDRGLLGDRSSSISPPVALEYLAAYPQLEVATTEALRVTRAKISYPAAIAGCLWLVFRDIDADANELFWHKIVTGADLPTGSPLLALRNRTMKQGKGANRRLDPKEVAALTIKAWNFWRQGRSISTLTWTAATEAFPTPH